MNRYSRLKNYFLNHKIFAGILIVIILVAGYYGYQRFFGATVQTTYLIAAAEKGTIITAVTGSGQVAAVQQISLQTKAGGQIVYVGAKAGDSVPAGTLLVEIDTANAKISLTSAQIAYNKLADTSSGSSVVSSQSYEDALNDVNKTFIDAATILDGLDSILNNYRNSTYKSNLPDTAAQNYYKAATASFWLARGFYDQTLADYRQLSRPIKNADTAAIVEETYQLTKLLSQMAKDASTYVSYVYNRYDLSARTGAIVTDWSNTNTWFQTIGADLTTMEADRNAIKNAGLDLQSQQLSLKQAQNNYADYFLYAPFDGVVGQLTVNSLDTVGSGSTVGIFASYNKMTTISLNEVDVANVKVGQKATLTFDAINDLTISGTVSQVDAVGTISSGVVSYNIKINFDSQDDRVKSGMSVSASIVTEIKADVLSVPNGAIKTSGGQSYVEVVGSSTPLTAGNTGITLPNLPVNTPVQIGLADDNSTEIISGLQAGDKVVTRTINPQAVTAVATVPSIFGATGGSTRNVGGVRATGGSRPGG